jgi:F-type H+-transporting ATPase subunit epsilon
VKTFVVHLQSASQYERLDDAVSFVGEDASGSFGILPGHARFMTVLIFGLARLRCAGSGWEYLALPGGLLYFAGNELYLSARRYVRDADYTRISTALRERLRAEETQLHEVKQSLDRLEEEMLTRLWRMQREKRGAV